MRRPRLQIGQEAEAIGVGAEQAAIRTHDDGVDRGDAPGQRVELIDQRHRRLLVRHGDVAAAEAQRRHAAQRRRQPLGRHRQRHIRAVDAIARQPMAMQLRRAGMPDRPADYPGQAALCGQGHVAPPDIAGRVIVSLRCLSRLAGEVGRPVGM
jgi:hypothetical protein